LDAEVMKNQSDKSLKSTNKVASASSMRLALENRLLFDGAVIATATEVLDDTAQEASADKSADTTPVAIADTQANFGHLFDVQADAQQPLAITSASPAGNKDAPNLLILDSRTAGSRDPYNNSLADFDVRVLDANHDGYQQITQILQDRGNTTDLHLLTATVDGKQWLGVSQITSTLTTANSESLADWGDGLAPNANIVFHGRESINNSWLNHVNALTGGQVSWSKDSSINTIASTDKPVNLKETQPNNQHDKLPAVVSPDEARTVKSLVFIDTKVKDYQTLLEGIDTNATVIQLDPNKDGVGQIAQVVSHYSNIDAIHIISHGSVGELYLGSSILNKANMQGQYADELALLGQHLSKDADILVYGCDFAQGAIGEDAVRQLSTLTGADIAASTNQTGSAGLGGDWLLERHVGQVDSNLAVDLEAQHDYKGLLASPVAPDDPTKVPGKFLILNAKQDPVPTVTGSGVGESALYQNVGTFNSKSLDVRLTVVASTTDGTFATNVANNAFLYNFPVSSGPGTDTARIRFEVLDSATGQRINTSYVLTLLDLDAAGKIEVNKSSVTGYGLSPATTLSASDVSGVLTFTGSTDLGNLTDPNKAIQLLVENQSFVDYTFTSEFSHSGILMKADSLNFIPNSTFANFDQGVTTENTPLVVPSPGVLSNDTDPDGDPLVVSGVQGSPGGVGGPVTLPSGAIVTVNANGSYTYNPNGAFNYLSPSDPPATDTFTYTVSDGKGGTDTGTVSITVNGVNNPPDAVNDGPIAATEDTPLTLSPALLLGNDTDPEGKPLTIASVQSPTHGTVALIGGNVIFTPAPGYNGPASFTYTISDSLGGTDTATVTLNIHAVNDPPVATPVSPSGNEDSPIPVHLAGTDVDGTVTSVTVTTLPPATKGVLYLHDGKTPVTAGIPLTPAQAAGLIFKPAPNFNGTVAIPFKVTDNNGAISAPANANITVNAVNDPPVAISGSTNTTEDTNATVNLKGTDIEDGTVTSVTVTTLPSVTQGILYYPGGTTPVTAGTPLDPTTAASLVFKPAPNFHGLVDISFTVKDHNGATSQPGSFVIDVADVNHDPVATPTTVTGTEDTPVPVSLTGTDVEGPISAVTVTKLPPAAQGILTKANGSPVVAGEPLSRSDAAGLIFKPAPNFHGILTVPFTVTDSDGQVSSPPADLTIIIGAVNDPPVATSVSPNGNEDTPIPVKLAGTDVDGTVASVTVTTLPPATQGILYLHDGITPVPAGTVLTPDQASGLIFKPAPNFNGTVTIPFEVTDNNGAISAPADANITVNAVNDPPVAINSSTNTLQDINANVSLTGTDVDGTVTNVTVTSLPPATQGTLFLSDGITPVTAGKQLSPEQAASLIFDPAPNFKGIVTIPFTVLDNSGTTSEAANFVIDVAEVNADPIATPTTVDGPKDTPVPVSLTGTDAEGPIGRVTIISLPPASQGILMKPDGTPVVAGLPLSPEEAANLKFLPAPNFSGTLTIPFTVTDSVGQVSSPAANLTINIGQNPNIGSLIMLSNPTPPLFSPSTGSAYSLLPFREPNNPTWNGYDTYSPSRLSLYDHLADYELYLTGSLRNQVVRELQSYSFSIPPGTFRHSNPNEKIEYEATELDGLSLPSWLHFDPKQVRFSGVPPKDAKNTEVMVTAKDQYGNEAYATFTVTVNREHDYNDKKGFKPHSKHTHHHAQVSEEVNKQAIVVGKLGFNEQIHSAGKLSRLMESRLLLNSFNKL
jgi:VCBS repeat-containing protein